MPVAMLAPTPTVTMIGEPSTPPSFDGFNAERALAAPLLQVDAVRAVQLDQTGEAWFRIDLPAGQAYELFTTNRSEGFDPVLALFNQHGDQLAYNDDIDGASSRIVYWPDESVTLFVWLGSVSPSPAGASCQLHLRAVALPPADAFEPDDTRDQAQPIALGEVQHRRFTHSGDVDWVRFEAQAGQIYLFRTFDLGEGVDTVLELYDGRGRKLADNDDTSEGVASAIVYASDVTETLYLKVSLHAPRLLDSTYRLTATIFAPAPPDAYEPNNGFAAAHPIMAGETQQHTISDEQDSDWLALTTRAGYAYRVTLQADQFGVDIGLKLIDPAGAVLAFPKCVNEITCEVTYVADDDTTVFLVIQPLRLFINNTGYLVRVEEVLAIAPDAYEPDNEVGAAHPIAVGETQQRTLRSTYEADFVRVRVRAGEAYLLRATSMRDELALSLQLLNSEGVSLVADSLIETDDGIQLRYLANADATLYLRITASRAPLIGAPYQLSLDTSPLPQPDPYEPDNDDQSARPIAAGETQQRNFLGYGDEDWLRLDLQAGQTYLIETFDLAEGVDTRIVLFNEHMSTLVANDNSNSDGYASRIEFRPPRSATYYLCISNLGHTYSGERYRVRLSVR
ncbi:hypothetical protein [Chloroflexus islandicus]|nr:hypothetical protein [Chloroflexus islandicus]